MVTANPIRSAVGMGPHGMAAGCPEGVSRRGELPGGQGPAAEENIELRGVASKAR
jgi:hypothetical protein